MNKRCIVHGGSAPSKAALKPKGHDAPGAHEPGHWDKLFAENEAVWGKEPSVGARYALIYFAEKEREARDEEAYRVLDVASGYGRDSNALAKKGFEVTGIDSSAEGMRQANEAALREGVAVRFVLGDVRMMPFPPESFDGVLCNGILSHLLPKERLMLAGEIERVLRKGGALVISEFSIKRRPNGAVEIDAEKAGEKGTFREDDGMVHHYFGSSELQALFPGIEFERIGRFAEARSNGTQRIKWVLAGVKK